MAEQASASVSPEATEAAAKVVADLIGLFERFGDEAAPAIGEALRGSDVWDELPPFVQMML